MRKRYRDELGSLAETLNMMAARILKSEELKNDFGEAVTLKDANDSTDQKWVFVPTGDDVGSYSIRTTAGQALDLDTGQNKIQLYHYLGYNNQRWIFHKIDDGTVSIISAHHKKALEVSADGTTLSLSELDPTLDRQKWVITN